MNRSYFWILALVGGLALTGLAPSLRGAPSTADPQKAADLGRQAQEAYGLRDYTKSAELFAAAIASGAKGPEVHYNAACAAALAGQKDAAFRHLEAAAAEGFSNDQHLLADTDLAGLHGDPRWATAVAQVRAAGERRLQGIGNRALREELLQMRAVDQQARQKVTGLPKPVDPAIWREVEAIDVRNTARMKEIVAAHGWPGKSLVGEDGANAAWLLVQHADKDPEFQQRCLDLLAEAVKKGEASGQDLAYLTDRVLVAQKKPQRYGTQVHEEGGKRVPMALEDEAHVDQRRAEVGLPPLAEYMKQIERIYTPRKEPAAKPPAAAAPAAPPASP